MCDKVMQNKLFNRVHNAMFTHVYSSLQPASEMAYKNFPKIMSLTFRSGKGRQICGLQKF